MHSSTTSTNVQIDSNLPVRLADRIGQGTYAGYAYAYPHKTSYRPLDPPIETASAWEHEATDALFLYVHIPFCEMRCGFCNLFTTIGAGNDFVAATMEAIERQSVDIEKAIAPSGVAQVAFGGGTPSYLGVDDLVELFDRLGQTWPLGWGTTPTSFEISPSTVDHEKLAALRSVGVSRISMGVQSFVKDDLKAMARPQRADDVDQACHWINDLGFETFNLDLIYGTENQTVDDWLYSLEQAVLRGPNELYLYPLYVRALTGLGRTGRQAGEHRRELYRLGRDYLLDAGYTQESMRLFRRLPDNAHPNESPALDYCCQDDGMVGLGPGARSYTTGLHYSSEYAVGQPGVRSIIKAFNQVRDNTTIDYGVRLDLDEQQRRYVIKSLLRRPGLDGTTFSRRFGIDPFAALPQLGELEELGLGVRTDDDHLVLTTTGLEHSDTIGPWLYSPAVSERMDAYELV